MSKLKFALLPSSYNAAWENMKETHTDFDHIIRFLLEKRGVNLAVYRHTYLERQLQKRLLAKGLSSYAEYSRLLRELPEEVDALVNEVINQNSHFFRHLLTFEVLYQMAFPALTARKARQQDLTLRLWSAGCAGGEEAYSLAILLHEWFGPEKSSWTSSIFATDIDKQALKKAETAIYTAAKLRHVRYEWVQKYFLQQGNMFQIFPDLKASVFFSEYDLLNERSYSPPESIFGNFDIIFCRNVLMYFTRETQERIFRKLFRALTPGGVLVLGEAETCPESYRNSLVQKFPCCKIYEKC